MWSLVFSQVGKAWAFRMVSDPYFSRAENTTDQWSMLVDYCITQRLLQVTLGLIVAKLSKVISVMSDSVRPHRRQPNRLPRPWDSPGKNTEVGCHFLLQCMKVKNEREVAQSCPTLSGPMNCSLPGSSIHGIFQARVLEWGAIAFSLFLIDVKITQKLYKLMLVLFTCSRRPHCVCSSTVLRSPFAHLLNLIKEKHTEYLSCVLEPNTLDMR